MTFLLVESRTWNFIATTPNKKALANRVVDQGRRFRFSANSRRASPTAKLEVEFRTDLQAVHNQGPLRIDSRDDFLVVERANLVH
jgi:hypothetical protein